MTTPEIVIGAITILAEIARDPLRDQRKLQGLLQAVMESSQRTLAEIERVPVEEVEESPGREETE